MACIKDATLFDLLEAHGSDMIATQFQVRERCGTSFFCRLIHSRRLLCSVVVTRLVPCVTTACLGSCWCCHHPALHPGHAGGVGVQPVVRLWW